MKTQYQKLYKYSLNSMVFGKTRKKDNLIFWVMIGLIFLVGIFI